MEKTLQVDIFTMIGVAVLFGAGGLFLGVAIAELPKKLIKNEKIREVISFSLGITFAIIGGIIGIVVYIAGASYFQNLS